MIKHSDYATIHDLIQQGNYEAAAHALLLQSRAAVADFVKAFTHDEGSDKMNQVIRQMGRIEKELGTNFTLTPPVLQKTKTK